MSKSIIEYIWIDGFGNLRSKTKVIDEWPIPVWNYDGSSTGQAINDGSDTEITLVPVKIVPDPFRRYSSGNTKNCLALCATYKTDDTPALNNNRDQAVQIFKSNPDLEPWYGLEQEYFMSDSIHIGHEHAWPMIKTQSQWYCGIGGKQPSERLIVEEHLEHCVYSGLQISGLNAEVAPYQWEYQIGPCVGIDSGDQHMLSRYILERIAEKYGIEISYKPKITNELNGSGCHTNFSTTETRSHDGLKHIYQYIDKLSQTHSTHIKVYGEGNEVRLTGHHETSSIDKFSYGVGTRNTSIRIPNQVVKDKCGYFEDRRPAANIDPYLVTSIIFKTCCL